MGEGVNGRNHTQVSKCSTQETYSGLVCRDALSSWQMCFSGKAAPSIPSLMDHTQVEHDAQMLLQALPILNPSPECAEKIEPFLCLYLFGLCDSDGVLHTLQRSDCLYLREDVCSREWDKTVQFLGASVLPVCENLPDITDDCIGTGVDFSGF